MLIKVFSRSATKITLLLMLAVFWLIASKLFIGVEAAAPTAQQVDGIEEIVVVGNDGYVYAYDYEGEQVFKSPEGGWSLVATADLNGDGDHEIIAVGGNNIKVYDPQVSGTAYTFSAAYSGSGGSFTHLEAGNLLSADNTPEFALLRSVGDGSGRIVIYDPPATSPVIDEPFLTDWRDFSLGDYDGDGDDDFALIHWDASKPSGLRNWFELRYGHDPKNKLANNSSNAGEYSNEEWVDIVAANFVTNNGNRVEWVGSRNASDNQDIIAQQWAGSSMADVWFKTDEYEFLTNEDFRDDKRDQVAMLRNVSGNSTSLRLVAYVPGQAEGVTWLSLTGLGTGWLNIGSGNIDAEVKWKELVILRANLIRVYRSPQSSDPNDFDCSQENKCLEISGSFKEALAIGDLGVDIESELPVPYEVMPNTIQRSVLQNAEVDPATLFIRGEKEIDVPLNWGAIPLPYLGSETLRAAINRETNLTMTITSQGLRYNDGARTSFISAVPWMTLSAYTGTTPATVTVSFSNTHPGSPLHEEKAYQAMILVWQTDLPDDRFRVSDVTIIVGVQQTYLPVIIK